MYETSLSGGPYDTTSSLVVFIAQHNFRQLRTQKQLVFESDWHKLSICDIDTAHGYLPKYKWFCIIK
jgi:hypothetical protein